MGLCTEEELLELEERLLDPQFRRNRAAVSALLADEFIEQGSSGGVFDRRQILDLLESEDPVRMLLANFQARMLSPEIALVRYRTTHPDGPPEPNASFLRCSLWVCREGRWQIIFHQGTRIPAQTAGEQVVQP